MRLFQLLLLAAITSSLFAQDPDRGKKSFESRCARCHGADGNGGEMGPAILGRLAARDNDSLTTLIHNGLPDRGMPPSQVDLQEMSSLLGYLRSIQQRSRRPVTRLKVETTDGKTLDGLVLGQGFEDLQLRTADNRVHLLRLAGTRYREVTSDVDWPTYNGDPRGNRYTELTQINKNNIARLASRWIFNVPGAARLQTTPVVVGGIMYVTGPDEVYALDAGTGRQIWRYQVPQDARPDWRCRRESRRGCGGRSRLHGDR